MSGDQLVRRSTNLLQTALVDGEIIALDVEAGLFLGFNDTASRVWELIAEPVRVSALVAQLREEYDVDLEQCRTQLEALLAHFSGRGLVSLTD